MYGGFNRKQMKVAMELARTTGQRYIYLVPKTKGNVYRIESGVVPSYHTTSGYASINLNDMKACKLNDPVKQDDGNYSGTVAVCASVNIKNYNIEVPGTKHATVIVIETPSNEDIQVTLADQQAKLLREGVSPAEVNAVTPFMALTLVGDIDIIPDFGVKVDSAFYEHLRTKCAVNGGMNPKLFKRKLQLCFHPDKNRSDPDAAAIFRQITETAPDALMQGYLSGTFTVPTTVFAPAQSNAQPQLIAAPPVAQQQLIAAAPSAADDVIITPMEADEVITKVGGGVGLAQEEINATPGDEITTEEVKETITSNVMGFLCNATNKVCEYNYTDVRNAAAVALYTSSAMIQTNAGEIIAGVKTVVSRDIAHLKKVEIPWNSIMLAISSVLMAKSAGMMGGRRRTSKRSRPRRRRTGKKSNK